MENALLPHEKEIFSNYGKTVFPGEKLYTSFSRHLLTLSALVTAFVIIPIMVDITARVLFGASIFGIIEIETLSMVVLGYLAVPFVTAKNEHIKIDLFYTLMPQKVQLRLDLFTSLICAIGMGVLTYQTFITGIFFEEVTQLLKLPESFFILVSSLGIGLVTLGFIFHFFRALTTQWKLKDFFWIIILVAIVCGLFALPFIYKAVGVKLSPLIIGSLGFLILFTMLMLRVPIGIGMCVVGILGLTAILRTPAAVVTLIGDVPYRQATDFIFLAVPMFMLMGEFMTLSGLSHDLFDCAKKWLGKLPGGLAVATVGGCAGFGAVCGDSLATVITMSGVALGPMKENNYDPSLSTGALAAGGTLGILIPPSMGFIMYSIMTQESVGQLFVAGIVPGILLTIIFMGIIVFRVKRNPKLAPLADTYSLKERLIALVKLIPVIILFVIVVGGIMIGMFTPGEAGAVGALGALIFALARGRMDPKKVKVCVLTTADMCGKIFFILVGVFVFGAFLTASRLPQLLADFITNLDVNRYVILFLIIMIYILLGCVMNIMPMMMLTMPAIFPTVVSLGFDPIWFGVVSVIVMEMGMITPPVGMNVFTMASLAVDIPMMTIFKGVMPFFIGMLICVILLILFPQIALFLL